MKYKTLYYQKNINNPYGIFVRKMLAEVTKDTSFETLRNNLRKYSKSYTKISLKAALRNSTLDTRSFLKFMLASEKKEFTIKITDEDIATFLEYEKENIKN